MKKTIIITVCFVAMVAIITAFDRHSGSKVYFSGYNTRISGFQSKLSDLVRVISQSDINSPGDLEKIRTGINEAREKMKAVDFWFRYLESTVYKRINGPLPVEWETEVFEKFEKPYKREGAGLTLAALYTEEEGIQKDSLISLVQSASDATNAYIADSIATNLETFQHFFLCNRLFLLNLAAIYTTGFECPDTSRVIPELRQMLDDVSGIYRAFDESFPATALDGNYISLYEGMKRFASHQPDNYSRFDHYSFIRDYVNPLFGMNQRMLRDYKVISRSFVDYSLNKVNNSIFDKSLYNGQNTKGIFLRVNDKAALDEISKLGKLLFYDPILSGNNKRSCASCHKPTEYFTDTVQKTALQFNHTDALPRNTPSLIDVPYNHLVMLDGAHISLQNQTRAVIGNPVEMGGNEKQVLEKIMSCPDYKKAFTRLLQYTPTETEVTFEHVISAITVYYGKFSQGYSPFDDAMNKTKVASDDVRFGFNLFMSKSQCATCHFVPQFNGVKPPYVGSEFEVLGVPADTAFRKLSPDKGRYDVNPAEETLNAFRTGSLRNSEFTGPYMHNGVFRTLNEVVDFYDTGGGAGRGLDVPNQTLSSDSLHLSKNEKLQLVKFLQSLNEKIVFEAPPRQLPRSTNKELDKRKVGGEY